MASITKLFRTLFTLQIVTEGNGISSIEVCEGVNRVTTGLASYFFHTSEIKEDATNMLMTNDVIQRTLKKEIKFWVSYMKLDYLFMKTYA